MSRTRLAALVVALAAGGCGSSPVPSDGDPNAVTTPTWYHDIQPIVAARCAGCHIDGGLAPMKLQTYEDVAPLKDLVRAQVSQRLMPPWPPDNKCRKYKADRGLTDDQVKLVEKWADAGAPKGDAADVGTPLQSTATKLSREDFMAKMPVAYTPQKSPDDYRCFLVDGPSTDAFITGANILPDNKKIVHHVIIFLAPPDKVASYQAKEGSDGAPGFSCFGVPSGNPTWLTSWAPGGEGADFPAGTGLKLPAGSKLIIQVHYNTSSAMPAPDQSAVALKLDPTVEKEARILPFTDYLNWLSKRKMNIDAGDPDAHHEFEVNLSPYLSYLSLEPGKPITIHSAALHMHTHGTKARTSIFHGADEECLLDIPHWDFGWQGAYQLDQTTVLGPTDNLSIECHWDNSKSTVENGMVVPPKDMNWGEGTGDEMCLGVFYVTQ